MLKILFVNTFAILSHNKSSKSIHDSEWITTSSQKESRMWNGKVLTPPYHATSSDVDVMRHASTITFPR